MSDNESNSNSSNSDSSNSDSSNNSNSLSSQEEQKKQKSNRGRKPIPEDQKRKNCRYIKCDNCDHVMEYWFGKPEYRKPRVVEPEMTKQEKTKIYNARHQAKLKAKKQNECLISD